MNKTAYDEILAHVKQCKTVNCITFTTITDNCWLAVDSSKPKKYFREFLSLRGICYNYSPFHQEALGNHSRNTQVYKTNTVIFVGSQDHPIIILCLVKDKSGPGLEVACLLEGEIRDGLYDSLMQK